MCATLKLTALFLQGFSLLWVVTFIPMFIIMDSCLFFSLFFYKWNHIEYTFRVWLFKVTIFFFWEIHHCGKGLHFFLLRVKYRTHIWKVGSRNLIWERTCGIYLSGSRLSHSMWVFPVLPFNCTFHYFIFLYSWIVYHSVYVPPFHYPSFGWWAIWLFTLHGYCE